MTKSSRNFIRMHADKVALDTAALSLYMTFVRILGDKLTKRLIR